MTPPSTPRRRGPAGRGVARRPGPAPEVHNGLGCSAASLRVCREHLLDGLDHAPASAGVMRVTLLTNLGVVAWALGDVAAGIDRLEQARALARRADTSSLAHALADCRSSGPSGASWTWRWPTRTRPRACSADAGERRGTHPRHDPGGESAGSSATPTGPGPDAGCAPAGVGRGQRARSSCGRCGCTASSWWTPGRSTTG